MYEYSAISHVQQQQKMYSTYMYYNTVSQCNTNRKRITYSKVGKATDGLGLRTSTFQGQDITRNFWSY